MLKPAARGDNANGAMMQPAPKLRWAETKRATEGAQAHRTNLRGTQARRPEDEHAAVPGQCGDLLDRCRGGARERGKRTGRKQGYESRPDKTGS